MSGNGERLYDRLGWAEKAEKLAAMVEGCLRMANKQYPRARDDWRVLDPALAAVALYLVDRRSEARDYAKPAVEEAKDCFLGRYEGLDDKAPAWRQWPWMTAFEQVVWCAASLGLWEDLTQICSYVREDLRLNFEHTEQERLLYLAIAACCRGEDEGTCTRLVEAARTGAASAEYRLAAETLAAIGAQDQAGYEKALQQFLERFAKSASVRDKSDITRTVSTVGTFLYHYAIHRGLAAVQLPPSLMDRIVVFPTSDAR